MAAVRSIGVTRTSGPCPMSLRSGKGICSGPTFVDERYEPENPQDEGSTAQLRSDSRSVSNHASTSVLPFATTTLSLSTR